MLGKLIPLCILAFNVLADTYFYFFAVRKATCSKMWRIGHWIIDALFVAAMIVLFFASGTMNGVSPILRQTFLFIYLLVYLSKTAYLLFSWPVIWIRNQRWKRLFYTLGIIFGSVVFCVMLYGHFVGTKKLQVNEVSLVSPKVPPGFDGFRIALISDFHIGNMRTSSFLEKIAEEIRVIKPDLVVFGGDMVHNRTQEVFRFADVLEQIQGNSGTLAVLGNHDYGRYAKWPTQDAYDRNLLQLRMFYSDIGWLLLEDESIRIRQGADSVVIMGTGYKNSYSAEDRFQKVLEREKEGGFKILITHNPQFWEDGIRDKTDMNLTLSGHTHAGQLAFGFGNRRISPVSRFYKYWGGLYQYKDQYLYVNEGAGSALVSFRLGAWPELTVITLRHELR